jgi:uncharacterized Zn-binding protein involved in type VI secretion
MGVPAAVMGDLITGSCPAHLIPTPTGAPGPSPMPFSAPVTVGLAATVLIGGRPAAVVGSSGMCTPPHVGLHPSDPFMVPLMQQGIVMMGSTTVLFEGRPAAKTGSTCNLCGGVPGGILSGSAANVLIGG